jgi:flavodoxin
LAECVSELSGAEIYRIEAANPYPQDYNPTADRAKQEGDSKTYPEIANPVQSWEDYDTVFMGYPIWWYELPMIVQGFVRDHDWSGKTIVPFNSHEGSGDGCTYEDLRKMTGANVLEGIAIRGGDVASSLDKVNQWYAAL